MQKTSERKKEKLKIVLYNTSGLWKYGSGQIEVKPFLEKGKYAKGLFLRLGLVLQNKITWKFIIEFNLNLQFLK